MTGFAMVDLVTVREGSSTADVLIEAASLAQIMIRRPAGRPADTRGNWRWCELQPNGFR